MFESLRQVIGVFRYLHNPELFGILQSNIRNLQEAADIIGRHVPQLQYAGNVFQEFVPDWYRYAADLTRTWLSDRLIDIAARYTTEIAAGTAPPNAAQMQRMVRELYDQLHYIKSPFDP